MRYKSKKPSAANARNVKAPKRLSTADEEEDMASIHTDSHRCMIKWNLGITDVVYTVREKKKQETTVHT
jgi:hypothetical protein